jgi:hypothetical protein
MAAGWLGAHGAGGLLVNQTQHVAGPPAEGLEAMYKQVGVQHDRIDDFRAKLLGFLPVVTGVGLFALVQKEPPNDPGFLVAIGIFGALASIGLFVHELRGITDCYMLTSIGHKLEESLAKEGDAKYGPFTSRLKLKGWYEWWVSRETAACIVYPATITAWAVLAAWAVEELHPGALGPRLPMLALVLFIGAALIAYLMLHWSFCEINSYIKPGEVAGKSQASATKEP